MSLNTIERIFWEFGDEPARVTAFLKDRDRYLEPFQLTDAERRMVRTMDVKALDAHGVSNMLIMDAFNAVNGKNPLLLFDYLRRLNDGRMINRMKIPGWQFNMLRLVVGVRNAWVGALSLVGLKKRFG